MRAWLTTAAELLGIGAIAAGCWWIYAPVGLIVAGIGMVALGVVNG